MQWVERPKNFWEKVKVYVPTPIRLAIVFLVGVSLIVVGLVLLVLPGPGLLFIFLGVAVLATEFAWAASILHHSKKAGNGLLNKVRKNNNSPVPTAQETDIKSSPTGRTIYEREGF